MEDGNTKQSQVSGTDEPPVKIYLTKPDSGGEALSAVNNNQTLFVTLARILADPIDEDFVSSFCKHINHTGFNRRVITIQSTERFVTELSIIVHPTADAYVDNGEKFTPIEFSMIITERDKLDKRDRSIQFTMNFSVGHLKESGVIAQGSHLYVKPYPIQTYHRFISDASILIEMYYNSSKEAFDKDKPDPDKGAVIIPLTKR